jgi:hypothetical protein
VVKKEEKEAAPKHNACQRFLDRGNKPVPLNYEEQDVLPLRRPINESFQRTGPTGKISLADFDEEINGINMSKLFSAYGPSTVIDPSKSFPRRTKTQGQARLNSQSPMNASAGINRQSLVNEADTNEDSDDDPDFSNFEEPIIVRLMANMFGQKKSVQEGLEMLPEISVDKIERELKSLKYQAMAQKEKEKRDQSQWELHKKAEEFITKFPPQTFSNPELMEFGCELSELR